MSSPRNSAAILAACFAALTFLSPARARAFELRLWPLATVARGEEESRFSLLGPIVEWRREPDRTVLALRPLFTAERDHRDADDSKWSGTFLYPLAWWESGARGLFLRILGLVTYERETTPEVEAAEPLRAFTLFPFVFYRERADGETSFALLPVYARLRDFAGYQRIRMLLFPLFLELEEPLWARSWFPFPFVSKVSGPAGRGFRVWPAYGWTELGASKHSKYVGWPFYIREVVRPGRDDQVTTRISWPFFSVLDGADLDSTTYGYLLIFPIYTHSIDRKNDTETWGYPWPAWLEQRRLSTGERLTIRYAPFYQDRQTPVQRSVFWFWPLYRHREGRGDDPTFERTDVLFLAYRDQHEGEGRTRLHTRVAFPFFVARETPERSSLQSLTFLDGLFPKNERLRELWAPLYRLYGSETQGGRTNRDLLWRAIEWGDDGLRPPWYLGRAR